MTKWGSVHGWRATEAIIRLAYHSGLASTKILHSLTANGGGDVGCESRIGLGKSTNLFS